MIPTLELTLTCIIFRFRFSLFVLFRYCLSDLCSGSLIALWFPELCTSIHLFLIWLVSLLLFAILLAVFAFEGRVRVRENV